MAELKFRHTTVVSHGSRMEANVGRNFSSARTSDLGLRTSDFGPRTSDFDKHQIMAIQIDEQLRRYEDLARRAGDLRSYL